MKTPAHFLPSTFEERGTNVPFTTPTLAYTRVRKDYRDRLELLVPRMITENGIYVVPWPALTEVATLTTHDLMLYDAVRNNDIVNPWDMRLAALAAAKSGLAGIEVAEAAEKALSDDRESKALSKVMLILKVLEDAAPDQARELVRVITSSEGQERVRQALFNVADKLDLDPALFDQRLSSLGDTIYGVGLAWGPIEPRLRRVLRQLSELLSSMKEWTIERLSDAAEQARFCADVAELTVKIGTETLQKIDGFTAEPRAIVEHWNERHPQVIRLCSKLDWLLDGWAEIIQWWSLSHAEGESAEITALDQIVSILPLIPRDELENSRVPTESFAHEGRRKWVRMNVDWRTGQVDAELQFRLEALKAQAA